MGEILLGGHDAEELLSGPLLIDDHGSPVADPVRTLYAETVARGGPLATRIEWDNNVQGFPVFLAEANRAAASLSEVGHALAS